MGAGEGTGAIELRKVHGEMNPADMFTKHLSSRDRMNQLVKLFNCEFRDGRADSAPHLRRQQTTAQEGTVAIATRVDSRGRTKTHQTVDAPPPQRQQRRDECSRVGQLDVVKDGSIPMILACCRMSMDLRISMCSFPELVCLILTMKVSSRCAFALGPSVALASLECLSRRLPGLNPGSALMSSSVACSPGMPRYRRAARRKHAVGPESSDCA